MQYFVKEMFCSLNNLAKSQENVNFLAAWISDFGYLNFWIMNFWILGKNEYRCIYANKTTNCLSYTPRLLPFVSNPRAGDQNQVYEVVSKQNEP